MMSLEGYRALFPLGEGCEALELQPKVPGRLERVLRPGFGKERFDLRELGEVHAYPSAIMIFETDNI